MDKLTAILAKYWDDGFINDLMHLTEEELAEVAETLDAFMNDFRIVKWKSEDIAFGPWRPDDE